MVKGPSLHLSVLAKSCYPYLDYLNGLLVDWDCARGHVVEAIFCIECHGTATLHLSQRLKPWSLWQMGCKLAYCMVSAINAGLTQCVVTSRGYRELLQGHEGGLAWAKAAAEAGLLPAGCVSVETSTGAAYQKAIR